MTVGRRVHRDKVTAVYVNSVLEYHSDGTGGILEPPYVALHTSFCAIVHNLRTH